MADIPDTLRSWSATAGSNSPTGGTSIGTGLDDNLRAIQAAIRGYLAGAPANMASASTVDLSTATSNYVNITGTTTITALGTESSGVQYLLKFAGALTLTHNATSLILPGGANITTKSGDVALVVSEGSGNWRVLYSSSSALGSFLQSGTGATTRDVQAKLRDILSVKDFGAVDDGSTDNTTTITTLFSNLGASYTGVIKIPYGVKYDFSAVAALAPVRATIIDESAINGWDTAGSRQKIVGYWESGDATSVVDMNHVISSGHNAVQWLENRGTSGSASGDSRVAATGWSSGRFQQGQPGIRSMSKVEWKQSSFRSTLWDWQLRKYATWAARDYEIWAAGLSFTTGDYIITSGRTFVAASSGTTGATEPTHTAGTVSDGGVDWTYVETAQDSYVWGVDEHGRMSTNASTAGGYTYRFKQSSSDSESLLVAFEGTGTSKTVALKLNGTNSGGTQQAGPFFQASTAGVLDLFNGAGTVRLFSADADSFDVGPLGRREVTASDGDTTPTVVGAGVLVVSNTGATNISALDDGASTQEVMMIFTNGNTTLVHSTTFRLRGAANVTPTTSGTNPFPTIVMKKFSGSSAWFEISRNF